ncbi:hypothetical protein C9J85_13805 [Haloferax sp. wsp5]|nr:hypothetical protein C9J85_13805 [Haloferax sp. wsp5]
MSPSSVVATCALGRSRRPRIRPHSYLPRAPLQRGMWRVTLAVGIALIAGCSSFFRPARRRTTATR